VELSHIEEALVVAAVAQGEPRPRIRVGAAAGGAWREGFGEGGTRFAPRHLKFFSRRVFFNAPRLAGCPKGAPLF
jgi:hypothetical protein